MDGIAGKLLTRRGSAEVRRRELAAVQRSRLAGIVAYARAGSPYYAQLYSGLPDGVDDVALLPPTDKPTLMANFDSWSTDRAVTWAQAQEFVANPDLVGRRFLGKYTLTTTSGTTGHPGVFVISEDELGQVAAIQSRARDFKALATLARSGGLGKIAKAGGRTATIAALGGHFGLSVAAMRDQQGAGNSGKRTIVPVGLPLDQMVDALNTFQPAVLNGYSGVVSILAAEKAAGRLTINPGLVVVGGDELSDDTYGRIGAAFDAEVVEIYACSEAYMMGRRCGHGWMHVYSDWVVLEPVDSEFRPTPPGELSHTVLLSVLFRRAQPILRYNLGDAVVQRPDPCPCGSVFPAFRVKGRSADVLRAADGRPVAVAQFLLHELRRRVPKIMKAQLIQVAPDAMDLKLRPVDGVAVEEVWDDALTQMRAVMAENGLGGVVVAPSPGLPELSAAGKYRDFIPGRFGQGQA